MSENEVPRVRVTNFATHNALKKDNRALLKSIAISEGGIDAFKQVMSRRDQLIQLDGVLPQSRIDEIADHLQAREKRQNCATGAQYNFGSPRLLK
jgi:hypothetical protein